MQSLKSPLSGSSLNRLKLPKAIISYKASASNLAQSVSASRIITARAKLGETSLFGGDTSSLIGGGATGVEAGSSSKPKLEDVALNSEVRQYVSNAGCVSDRISIDQSSSYLCNTYIFSSDSTSRRFVNISRPGTIGRPMTRLGRS